MHFCRVVVAAESMLALPLSLIHPPSIAACRTSGRRLGYVQQMFVDPGSLSVVSLYLRRAANSIGAKNGEGEAVLC